MNLCVSQWWCQEILLFKHVAGKCEMLSKTTLWELILSTIIHYFSANTVCQLGKKKTNCVSKLLYLCFIVNECILVLLSADVYLAKTWVFFLDSDFENMIPFWGHILLVCILHQANKPSSFLDPFTASPLLSVTSECYCMVKSFLQ